MYNKPEINVPIKALSTPVVADRAPALCAAILGLVLIFVAGFAETDILHNAAHDSRHTAAFPCH
jgi:cobalt transporter subunit CbtB